MSSVHPVQNRHEFKGEDNVATILFIRPHPSRQESTDGSAGKAWKLREARREEELIKGCSYWEPGNTWQRTSQASEAWKGHTMLLLTQLFQGREESQFTVGVM